MNAPEPRPGRRPIRPTRRARRVQPTRRAGPTRPTWTAAAVAAAALTAGLGLIAVGRAGGHATAPTEVADATDVLEAEIDQMLDAGLPADHPKVAALQEDLAALEAGAQAQVPTQTEVGLSETLGPPHRGGAQALGDSATENRAETAWDQGQVDCEPIPPDRLTWDEIVEASCVSVPRPDGTSRYVAVVPDGTVRVVRFSADGSVTRQPDQHVDLRGRRPDELDLRGNAAGDLVVGPAGAPGSIATVDLG